MQKLPRITLIGAGEGDDALQFAACIAASAVDAGLRVCTIVIAGERCDGEPGAIHELSKITGRSVHRLDPRLVLASSVDGITGRVAAGADLTLVVSCAPLAAETAADDVWIRALIALAAPIGLCLDAAAHRAGGRSPADALDRARRVLSRHDVAPHATPMALIADGPVPDAAGLGMPSLMVSAGALPRILEFARRASALPNAMGERGAGRARVGLLMDECFDLHDEESLAQFEAAGAELVPISALEGSLPMDLDGLIVGDAAVERYSVPLAQRRDFRRDLRGAIESGLPTIAAGGGFAYLTRGIRTLGGALHPLVGAIEAEALAIDRALPGGRIEVKTLVETLVGPAGTCIAGCVERSWVVRDIPREQSGIYTTLSGPADEGCGQQSLFATHFRPYWPSCPAAAGAFVDRCAIFAATELTESAAESAAEGGGDGTLLLETRSSTSASCSASDRTGSSVDS